MEKNEVTSLIQQKLAEGVITHEDLAALQPPAAPVAAAPAVPGGISHESSRNLINVFYAIGAIIVLGGVGILVGQNWMALGTLGRLLVTAGIATLSYAVGFAMLKPQFRVLSQVFFTIAAALAPLGAYVIYHELSFRFDASAQWPVALALAALFGIALYFTRRSVLYVFTIALLVWAYYAFLFATFKFVSINDLDIYKWATLILGFALVLIGYGLRARSAETDTSIIKETQSVRSIFYVFGTLAALGAGSAFSGTIADFLFIVLLFAVFYASVFLRSRWMLVLAALSLMGHIVRLTTKYFAHSIGWPVALIIIGFLIIGVGYLTFYLNKRFLSAK